MKPTSTSSCALQFDEVDAVGMKPKPQANTADTKHAKTTRRAAGDRIGGPELTDMPAGVFEVQLTWADTQRQPSGRSCQSSVYQPATLAAVGLGAAWCGHG